MPQCVTGRLLFQMDIKTASVCIVRSLIDRCPSRSTCGQVSQAKWQKKPWTPWQSDHLQCQPASQGDNTPATALRSHWIDMPGIDHHLLRAQPNPRSLATWRAPCEREAACMTTPGSLLFKGPLNPSRLQLLTKVHRCCTRCCSRKTNKLVRFWASVEDAGPKSNRVRYFFTSYPEYRCVINSGMCKYPRLWDVLVCVIFKYFVSITKTSANFWFWYLFWEGVSPNYT